MEIVNSSPMGMALNSSASYGQILESNAGNLAAATNSGRGDTPPGRSASVASIALAATEAAVAEQPQIVTAAPYACGAAAGVDAAGEGPPAKGDTQPSSSTNCAEALPAARYRECLKNHAAGMGGYALDGCCEFMPSGDEGSIEALTCAACQCHRNFHRRHVEGDASYHPNTGAAPQYSWSYSPRSLGYNSAGGSGDQQLEHHAAKRLALAPPPLPIMLRPSASPLQLAPSNLTAQADGGATGDHPIIRGHPGMLEDASIMQQYPYNHHHRHQYQHMGPALHRGQYYPSSSSFGLAAAAAGSTLMTRAGSYVGGGGGSPFHHHTAGAGAGAGAAGGKRFRTKFSMAQREKMFDFAEKIGWRIQKHDEAAVQQFCVDAGVKRHVLKVWMHNNKNTFGKKLVRFPEAFNPVSE